MPANRGNGRIARRRAAYAAGGPAIGTEGTW
jgi:hypothetical protein